MGTFPVFESRAILDWVPLPCLAPRSGKTGREEGALSDASSVVGRAGEHLLRTFPRADGRAEGASLRTGETWTSLVDGKE